MNTILYSAAGVISLVMLAVLFTYLDNLRNSRWKHRAAEIRRLVKQANHHT